MTFVIVFDMKKIFPVIVCVLLFSSAYAQKISDTEARQYLEKVWGYLKTSDSVSYLKLWLPEDSVWQKIHTPAEGMKLMESYRRLKSFLSPAENLDIDHISVGQENARGTEITAYFKAREHALMGFSFYVAPVNGKWTARGKPGYMAGYK